MAVSVGKRESMESAGPRTAGYEISAGISRITVRAFATGILSAMGHNPVISARDFSGVVRLAEGTRGHAELHIAVKAAALSVENDVSDKDRREIERQMKEEVLETTRFPEIVCDCSEIAGTLAGEGPFDVAVRGNIGLHGVTRAESIAARVSVQGDMLRASGEFTVRQTDYGIKLVSALGGALKVRDEVKIVFDIVARKQT